MATAPTLRQKNQLFKNRSAKGTVASKAAAQKHKDANKINYSYWVIGLFAFALFGGGVLSVLDLIF